MSSRVDQLAALDRAALIETWEANFGTPPPPSTSQDMMRLIMGWEIQAKRARADVRALKAAIGTRMRCNGRGKTRDTVPPLIKPKVVLSPGTRLSREWQGRTYSVDVLDKGFAYDGRLFTSLSPIAKAITGSHRSGPDFFGVSK